MTVKQRKYIANRTKGMAKMPAALAAGYAEGTARIAGARIENKPTVQSAFQKALQRAGISDTLLAKRIREGLDAKETKFFQHEGKVIEKRDVIAFSERRQMVELVAKIKNVIPKGEAPEAQAIQVQVIHIGQQNINASDNRNALSGPALPEAIEVMEIGR